MREVRALMSVSLAAIESNVVSMNRRFEMVDAADPIKNLWESQVTLHLKQPIMHISIVPVQCVAR